MARRNKSKNKILRFHPNGLQTKDRSYNNIKKLLNPKTSRTREVIDQKNNIEKTLREYLEAKKYNVYLCTIHFPLSITLIISPKLLQPDLNQFKYDFGLSDYEMEIETTDNTAQYYFRWWFYMNSANEMLQAIKNKKTLLKNKLELSDDYTEEQYNKDIEILNKEEREWLEQFDDVPVNEIYKED